MSDRSWPETRQEIIEYEDMLEKQLNPYKRTSYEKFLDFAFKQCRSVNDYVTVLNIIKSEETEEAKKISKALEETLHRNLIEIAKEFTRETLRSNK